MRTIVTEVWQRLLEILFPAVCLSCKRYLGKEGVSRIICQDCFSKIHISKSIPGEHLVAICSYENPAVKALIHGLKFRRFTNTLLHIRELISLSLKNNRAAFSGEHDFVTYIPLHLQRERARGFNQARLIAEILAEVLELPTHPTLRRIRNTKEQSSIKDHGERYKNVENCFAPFPGVVAVKDMNIILVDDVYTSGTTALEARNILKQLGANKVTIFVFAKAG